MLLRSLYLHNFRLYEEARFSFSEQHNCICGENAIGKTSLLEAIHYLITGRSFRTHQTANLIRHGAGYFYLEAHFVKHGIEQRLKVSYSKKERRIWLNNTPYPSSASIFGSLLGVVFSPDDLNLISGAPEERRQYLDTQLSQVDPLYLHHLSRYFRAMRQRNHLLKSQNLHTIESWEWEMATSASYLLHKRLQLIEQLQLQAQQIYSQIAAAEGSEKLQLSYRSGTKVFAIAETTHDFRDYYLAQFQKNRQRELLLATTLSGPHKDDLTFSLDGKEARYFASEGQKKSCAAALRLAEWHSLRAAADGEAPLMLIDDIGVSLDEKRYARLLQQLEGFGQVFLTATEKLEFGHSPLREEGF